MSAYREVANDLREYADKLRTEHGVELPRGFRITPEAGSPDPLDPVPPDDYPEPPVPPSW